MQQDRHRGHIRRAPLAHAGPLARAAWAAVLCALMVAVGAPAARAQTYGGDSGSVWTGLMKMFGMNKSDSAEINYQERPPLVVPRTRDLPPPVAAVTPGPDWPQDAPKPRLNRKGKPAIVPGTAVDTPNPQQVARPWYDPTRLFNKEEYAKFTGEPERVRLTDPPAGYRIPSPNEPYGIGPDKKGGISNPTSADMNLSPAGGQSSGH